MCGFAGVIHWDREPVSEEDLDGARELLRHRGPDEQTALQAEPGVGLAHCRLKVIDLSETGRQPMANEARTLWVCFNGEIYNFRDLRAELESLGRRFRGRSDTEVILRAYEQWGGEAVRRLDGMFAIAIWDSKRRELLLARDRTGKKPLYWWTDGRCLAFASEIKALAAHPHVPREPDERSLPHLLALGYPPPGSTCHRGIRQLLPATLAVFREGAREPRAQTYWNLPAPSEGIRSVKEADCKEELRLLLTASVEKRLVSDVPLGAFLSGGLDSTVVVGLMSRLVKGDAVRTFSIGFEGDPRFDETRFAEIAARRYGTRHTAFPVAPQPFELIERLVWHYDQPFGDSSALPTYILCGLTRTHVTVALSGDGGDELFAGYDRFAGTLWGRRVPRWLARAGEGALRSSPVPLHVRSLPGRLLKFFTLAQQPFARGFLQATGYFPSPDKILSKLGAGAADVWRQYETEKTGSPLTQLLALNFREYLPNDLQVKMDRCSMAHGLEARSPFLDTALVEWAFRLPDSMKLRGGVSKWILRETFSDLVPEEILRRKKAGFGVPLGAWFRGRWREPMMDLLGPREAAIYRYLRFDEVQRKIGAHLAGRSDEGQPIWLLLTLELWLRQMARPTAVLRLKTA